MAIEGDPIYPDLDSIDPDPAAPEHLQEMYAEQKWLDEQLANQPEEGIKGRILSFPVGDGRAFYKVTKVRPLTLNRFVVGDNWFIPDYAIRGLNRSDVEQMVESARNLARIFGRS